MTLLKSEVFKFEIDKDGTALLKVLDDKVISP